jgi:phosphatidyl-myo-inositol dimannoside synthase
VFPWWHPLLLEPLWEDIHPVEIPRTLIVTNDFPPRVGGIQRTLDSLCRELPPDRIAVVAPSCEGSERFDGSVPFEVVRERRRFVWPSPGVARRLDAVVARTGAEVVLFGDAFPLALMGSRLAEGGTPSVVLAHGFDYWLSTMPVAHSVMKRMTRPALRVAGCSEFISRRVRTAVPRDVPVSVLHPGADVERFRPDLPTADIRERHGLGDRPLIVCVSRLVPRKGQDVLIESMRSIQRRVPEASLLIVGSGPYESKLRALAEHAPTRSVTFAGEVPEDDLPRYYAAGDVFAMPCRTRRAGMDVEGLGIVYLEAAATGLPVVAGDSGGAPEAVVEGETGWVVPGRSVTAVAARASMLLADPAAVRAAGEKGRAWVEREWRWDGLAARLGGLLRE